MICFFITISFSVLVNIQIAEATVLKPLEFSIPAHDATVGSIPGEYSVSPSGDSGYTIPIVLPKGTGGMHPSLALAYSSSGGNSPLGMGWSVQGLSSINRCPTNRHRGETVDSVDFGSNDKFCLDGKRLVLISGNYGANNSEYRLENEDFTKIEMSGSGTQSSFTVWTPDGRIHAYGQTSNARLLNNSNAAIAVWALNKTEDRFGNYLSVEYEAPQGSFNQRAAKINYTANDLAGLSPEYSVVFDYKDTPSSAASGIGEGVRTDGSTRYMGGSKTGLYWLLEGIRLESAGVTIKEYTLEYKVAIHEPYFNLSKSDYTYLQSVELCAGGQCLPKTTFDWSVDNQYRETSDYNSLTSSMGEWDNRPKHIFKRDMNNDGLVDVLFGPEKQTGNWYVLRNNGSGFDSRVTWSTGSAFIGFHSEGDAGYVRVQDINNDNLPDVLLGPNNQGYWYVMKNNGNRLIYDGPWLIGLENWHGNETRINLTDLTGDGLPDILAGPSNKGEWEVKINTGSSFRDGGTWATGKYGNFDKSSGRVRVLDLNGDNRSDVLIGPESNGNWYVLENTGSAFIDRGTSWANNLYGNWRNDFDRIRMTDMNGDGLPDVMMGPNAAGDWFVMRNTGKKFIDVGRVAAGMLGEFSGSQDRIRVIDVTGDGLADVIAGPSSNGTWEFLRNSSTSFHKASQWYSGYSNWKGSMSRVSNVDLNGDGLSDILIGPDNKGTFYSILNGEGSSVTHTTDGPNQVLLEKVTTGTGHETNFTYSDMLDTAVYNQTNEQFGARTGKLTTPKRLVSLVATSNGLSTGEFKTGYRYEDFVTSFDGKGSPLFRKTIETNLINGLSTHTVFDVDFDAKTNGLVERVISYNKSGTLISDTNNDWSVFGFGSGSSARHCIQLKNTKVVKKDLNGAFLSREENRYTYEESSLNTSPKTTTSYLYGSETGSDLVRKKTTENTFGNLNSSTWLLPGIERMEISIETYDSDIPSRKKTITELDYHTDTGKKIVQRVLDPESEVTLTKTIYAIDKFGNEWVTTIEGPDFELRGTIVRFAENGRDVIQNINSVLYESKTSYYPSGLTNSGLVNISEDINGFKTKNYYDAHGRITKSTAFYETAKPVVAVHFTIVFFTKLTIIKSECFMMVLPHSHHNGLSLSQIKI